MIRGHSDDTLERDIKGYWPLRQITVRDVLQQQEAVRIIYTRSMVQIHVRNPGMYPGCPLTHTDSASARRHKAVQRDISLTLRFLL